MIESPLALAAASVIAGAAPIVLAAVGETITEKAGVINLSLDGSILLSAMVSFVVAYRTQNLGLGFLAGAFIGAAIASIVGWFGIYLGQSQVAVGFVLTLTARDLAYFLGNPYSRLYGPQAGTVSVPFLSKVPWFGQVLFQHSWPVYLSMGIIYLATWYLRTPLGIQLRSVGENPEAAFARGLDTRRIQMLYTLVGGFLVGLAGAGFSLCIKPGWGRPQGAEGIGWIALAIVIFGGWQPIRVAAGAYLFAFLQVMGIRFQDWWPSIPAQVFQVAPFPLMIFTLVVMHAGRKGSRYAPGKQGRRMQRVLTGLGGFAPAALGRSFRPE